MTPLAAGQAMSDARYPTVVDLPAPTVVVVAYRANDHLRECLAHLGTGLQVCVVDNEASEYTRGIVVSAGASYLATSHNLGFAAAVNIGLTEAPGRDVLLLNPDARITAAGVLALQRALHDPAHRRAAVGPALVDGDGRPDRADWPMPSPGQVWADAFGFGGRLRGRRFVTGAVLLLRADAIVALGGFDERYFLYAEESDWQQRAQQAGWDVAVIPEVSAVHTGAGSSSDNDARAAQFNTSARAFSRRWYGASGASLMRAGSVVAASRRSVLGGDRASGRGHLGRQLRSGGDAFASRRPSVAHVVRSDSFAGVEQSIVDVATEQHRRGWRVAVVGGEPARMRAELPPGVLHLPGQTVARAYRSLLTLGTVEVVHAHMTAAEIVAAAAKPRLGARLVTTRHFAGPRGSSLAARALGERAARRIDAEVAISEFVATSIEGPSLVVHNGVRQSNGHAARDQTVLVLQRLEDEKQTDVALQAWSASELPGKGWQLLIHGRGSQSDDLEALAGELGCAASVTFAGFTDRPRAVLASASILLATAPAEPFGLTLAEAMAEGTPVVAADGGAHREVAGPEGRYFPPGDAQAAARELDRLAALSDDERARLGERLRSRQRTRFTIARQVDQLLPLYRAPGPRVALLSLEPWDEVWRRNQHLASRLVRNGSVASILFVNPPRGGLALRALRHQPEPGITVVTPPLLVPRRCGGHRLLGAWLRRATADSDLWWVNDPVAGDAGRKPDAPAIYDVTDDWREVEQPAADRRRIVRAEDRLAVVAETVVCSRALAHRWQERYAVEATLIGNGVDVAAIRAASPRDLEGPGPHLVYVGTVHPNRVDVDLLCRLAEELSGTLHLVGPESLDPATRNLLDRDGVRRHGPVPSREVPGWLVSADVLICPHLVDEFTLSLDAIKAHEYLSTSRPVVATPSSGFEAINEVGVTIVSADGFSAATRAAVGSGPFDRDPQPDWDERAAEFALVLAMTVNRPAVQRVAAPRYDEAL